MSNSRFAVRHGRGAAVRAVIASGLSLSLFVACSGGSPSSSATPVASPTSTAAASPTSSPVPDKVVLGNVPIAGYAAVYVGLAAGYFKDAGIDLTIAPAVAFANIVPDVVKGTYQFGSVGMGTVAVAIPQNLPIQIVANAYYGAGEQALFVLSGSSIHAITDLAGKRIGLGALNNNFEAGIILQMKDAGVDTTTVKFTLLPPANLAAALRSGTVDAAQINEPDITVNGAAFRAIIPEPFKPFGAKPCGSYVIVDKDWAAQHSALVDRFIAAYNKGAELAASNKLDVINAVAAYTSIASVTLGNMHIPGFTSDLLKDSFAATVAGMLKLGFITRTVTVEEAFYNSAASPSKTP